MNEKKLAFDEGRMSEGRLTELLINAFEWAIEVSENATNDLIRFTGITSDELKKIGYEKVSFPSMHNAVKSE